MIFIWDIFNCDLNFGKISEKYFIGMKIFKVSYSNFIFALIKMVLFVSFFFLKHFNIFFLFLFFKISYIFFHNIFYKFLYFL